MDPTTTEPATAAEEHYDDSWAALPGPVKFGVVFAALVFLGVVVEGLLLTPWTIALHGWIPAPQDRGSISTPQVPSPPAQPGEVRSTQP